MASKNTFDGGTIKINTSLDPEGMINGLKRIQQQIEQLASANNTRAPRGQMAQLTQSMEEAEKSAKGLQQFLQNGVDPKNIKAYNAATEEFNKNIKVYERELLGFNETVGKTISTSSRQAAEGMITQLKTALTELRTQLTQLLSSSGSSGFEATLKKGLTDKIPFEAIANQILAQFQAKVADAQTKLDAANAKAKSNAPTLEETQAKLTAVEGKLSEIESRKKVLTEEELKKAEERKQIAEQIAQLETQITEKQKQRNEAAKQSQPAIPAGNLSGLPQSGAAIAAVQQQLATSPKFVAPGIPQVELKLAPNLLAGATIPTTPSVSATATTAPAVSSAATAAAQSVKEITDEFRELADALKQNKDIVRFFSALSAGSGAELTSLRGEKYQHVNGGRNAIPLSSNIAAESIVRGKTAYEEAIDKAVQAVMRYQVSKKSTTELSDTSKWTPKEIQTAIQARVDELIKKYELAMSLTQQPAAGQPSPSVGQPSSAEAAKATTKEAESAEQAAKKIGAEIEKAQQQLVQLKERLAQLGKTETSDEKEQAALLEQKKKLEEQITAIQNGQTTKSKAQGEAEAQLTASQQRLERAQQVLSTEGEIAKNYEEQIQKQQQLKAAQNTRSKGNEEAKRTQEEITQNLNREIEQRKLGIQQIRSQNSSLEATAKTQIKINTFFSQLLQRLSYSFSFFSIYNKVLSQIRKTFTDVQDLDKAFGSIAMVTTNTVSNLWKSYSKYAQIANKMGQSTQSAIEASALFYQQGLKTNDVLQLTESTMKLATLAGQDFKTSTKELTAAIRGFNLEMSEGEKVTDVYSELAAHAAADVAGIATAISKTASIANSAGASFENTAAFLTQIIETTQESPETAGTALKTVIARFSEVKQAVDDVDLEGKDINKMETALKSVGIALRDDTGEIRDFDDVILELSDKWLGLSRNTQRYIATIAAGSRQQSRFIALLDNPERLRELIEVAEESSGRSEQQFAKYADTIENKIKRLQNQWEQFRVRLLSADVYKKGIDLVSGLLKKVMSFDWVDITAITTTFLIFGKMAGQGFISGFSRISTGVGAIVGNLANKPLGLFANASFGNLAMMSRLSQKDQQKFINEGVLPHFGKSTVEAEVKAQNRLAAKITGNKKATVQHMKGQTPLNGTTITPEMRQKYLQESQQLAQQGSQILVQGISAGVVTGITTALTTEDTMKWLGKSLLAALAGTLPSIVNAFATMGMAAIPYVAVLTGISLLITFIVKGIKVWIAWDAKKAEENRRATDAAYDYKKSLEELSDAYDKVGEKVNELEQAYDNEKESYDTLTQKGEKLALLQNKLFLTSEEQQEYVNLSNEMAEIVPELVARYDAEGNAVITLGTQYEELVKAKEKAMDIANADLKNAEAEAAGIKLKQETREMLINNASLVWAASPEGQQLIDVDPSLIGSKKARGFETLLKETINNQTEDELITILEKYGAFTDNQLNNILQSDDSDDEKVEQIATYISDIQDEYKRTELISQIQNVLQRATNTILDTSKMDSILSSYRSALIEKVSSQLALDPDFKNLGKNAQQSIINQVLSQNLSGINNEKAEEFAKAEAEKAGTENAAEYQQAYMRAYARYFDDVAVQQVEIASDMVSKHAADTKWVKAWERYGELSFTNVRDEYSYIKQAFSSDELQAWLSSNASRIEDYNKQIQALASATKEGLIETDGILLPRDSNGLINKIAKLGDKAYTAFTNSFEKFQDSGIEDLFISNFRQISEGLNEADLSRILNFSWEDITDVNAKEMWDALIKSLSDEGKKKLENDEIQKIIEQTFVVGGDSLDSLVEAMDEKNDAVISNISTYEKTMKSYIENGVVDADSLKALKKANAPLEKILNVDGTLNQEELKKWLDEQIADNKTLYKQEIDKLKVQRAQLNFIQGQVHAQHELSRESYKNMLFANGLSLSEIEAQMNAFDEAGGDVYSLLRDLQNQIQNIDDQIVALEEDGAATAQATAKATELAKKQTDDNLEELRQKRVEEEQEAAEKIVEAEEKIQDAYDDIIQKQKDIIDRERELQEVYTGKQYEKSGIDGLYNLQNRYEVLKERADDLKKSLDELNGKPAKQTLNSYAQSAQDVIATLEAENLVSQSYIENAERMLRGPLQQYLDSLGNGVNVSFDDAIKWNDYLGVYELNTAYIQVGTISSNIIDTLEEMNNNAKEIRKRNKEIEELKQDYIDYQKKVRDDYVGIEEQITDLLEKFYQKQIDDRKEMYDSLSAADDEYLDALSDAIDKQRKLREQQDKWQDLAQKEKRLSLIQRDTSGTYTREIQQQQKDIEKDRQSMLDEAIDNTIDELKELYELQKETREDEIEFQQSLLDNANLLNEVTEIMGMDSETFYARLRELTEDWDKLSNASAIKMQEEWEGMYDTVQLYGALTSDDVRKFLATSAEDVSYVLATTSENLTSEADRAFGEMTNTMNEAIENGKKAVTDALDALTASQKNYNEAVEEYNKLVDEYQQKYGNEGIGSNDTSGEGQTSEPSGDYSGYDSRISELLSRYEAATNPNERSAIEKEIRQIDPNDANRLLGSVEPPSRIPTSSNKYDRALVLQQLSWMGDERIGVKYSSSLISKRLREWLAAGVIDKFDILNADKNGALSNISPFWSQSKFKKGGLADYTGPAWVDGTPSKPEAFLNAEDTRRIGEAATILRDITHYDRQGLAQGLASSIGDTNIEMHFHVDSIATEAQVDYLIDRVKEDIVDAAHPAGTSIIFR